jgi:hypothetical protein
VTDFSDTLYLIAYVRYIEEKALMKTCFLQYIKRRVKAKELFKIVNDFMKEKT